MIGFWLTDLLIPSDPTVLELTTPSGTWSLCQCMQYLDVKRAIRDDSLCANTYSAEISISLNQVAALVEQAQGEIVALCLGASFLTGLSCSAARSLPHSDLTWLQPSERLPRVRSIGQSFPLFISLDEFRTSLEEFIRNFDTLGKQEKVLLVVHHWLDGLACWSIEDIVLSIATILEIIAATESSRRQRKLRFNDSLSFAAERWAIACLSPDFRHMRNDLVHEGMLSANRWCKKNKLECATALAEALNWLDSYLCASLGLIEPTRQRFDPTAIHTGLNAYSL